MSAPGRTSPSANMTRGRVRPEGHPQPNVTYQAFATLAASLGLLGERTQAETVAIECGNASRTTAPGRRGRSSSSATMRALSTFVEGLRVAGISDA